jgi:hypothetical protein
MMRRLPVGASGVPAVRDQESKDFGEIPRHRQSGRDRFDVT